MRPGKLLILHHGALGDVLCARPALFALAKAFADQPRYALVKPDAAFFLRPLGYAPCPEELRGVEDAFHGAALPEAAAACRIFRFCLDKLPERTPQGARCLLALPREGVAVMQNLLDQSVEAGAPACSLAEERVEFQRSFGSWKGQGQQRIGIFPGSGHPAKNWPPHKFAELARALEQRGYATVQILGPVEEERGVRLVDIPALCPRDMRELTEMLKGLRLVIGNDSGPLHLAARLGVPCVVLFGPSPARRWGPAGAICLSSPLPCAPCSDTLRTLACARPLCMEAIDVKEALRAVSALL